MYSPKLHFAIVMDPKGTKRLQRGFTDRTTRNYKSKKLYLNYICFLTAVASRGYTFTWETERERCGVYLGSVEDAFDLHEVGDVPGVLGERAERKSVVSHKRWRPHRETKNKERVCICICSLICLASGGRRTQILSNKVNVVILSDILLPTGLKPLGWDVKVQLPTMCHWELPWPGWLQLFYFSLRSECYITLLQYWCIMY